MKFHPFSATAALLLCAALPLSAQVPQLINYQGRVAVGTPPVNFEGPGQFRFALVNPAGTTTHWRNSPDTTPADGVPDSAVSLTVTKGLYSVLLGDTSVTNMAAIPASVWTNADVRLRVWFDDTANGIQLVSPDQRLAPNGYLPDGAVSSAAIASGAITSAKIGTGAVQGANIAAGTVANTNLANSGITVTAGSGLSGGGAVSLGGNVTLTNSGVRSIANGGGITVNAGTGDVTLGSNATSANTGNTIMMRDAGGSVSIGTVTVLGNVLMSAGGTLQMGNAALSTSGGGAFLELRAAAGAEFIDFTNDLSNDFDVRLFLIGDDMLELQGGGLQVAGSVGIGRIPTGYKLEVEGNASKTTATAWVANSDRRIKEDIQTIGGALEMLDRVRLVDFRYRTDYRALHPSIEDKRYMNVIAQEFAEVFPDHVTSGGDKLPDGSAVLQVDTYPLTIYSAAAVQELHRMLKTKDAEIAALKKQVAAQEERDRALEARISRLEQRPPAGVATPVRAVFGE